MDRRAGQRSGRTFHVDVSLSTAVGENFFPTRLVGCRGLACRCIEFGACMRVRGREMRERSGWRFWLNLWQPRLCFFWNWDQLMGCGDWNVSTWCLDFMFTRFWKQVVLDIICSSYTNDIES